MIIDLILDRKEGKAYYPIDFYREVRQYEDTFDLTTEISRAMDYGNNKYIQDALMVKMLRIFSYLQVKTWLIC